MLTKTPRSIIADSALAVNALPVEPCIRGVEYIPREGSFVLVANHYQRLDLWIGWAGSLLIDTIAKRRDIVMRFVTTDRARIGRFTVPGTRWLIERVAAVWGVVLVTPPSVADERTTGQRYALLRILRLVQNVEEDVCIALMPEGDEGSSAGLIDAMPGSGRSLYALSKKGLPLLPAGVWEENGQLHVRFGAVFSLTGARPGMNSKELDDWARNVTMQNIADLLPKVLQGKYGRVMHGALE